MDNQYRTYKANLKNRYLRRTIFAFHFLNMGYYTWFFWLTGKNIMVMLTKLVIINRS